MLETLIRQLEQSLLEEVTILDVILRTEQSLFAAEERHEVEFHLAMDEATAEAGGPTAILHVFPLEQGAFELEIEVEYDAFEPKGQSWAGLFSTAQAIVQEVSLSEKRRYLSPQELCEHQAVIDFHFVLHMDEEEQEIRAVLSRVAQDIGRLLRLDRS